VLLGLSNHRYRDGRPAGRPCRTVFVPPPPVLLFVPIFSHFFFSSLNTCVVVLFPPLRFSSFCLFHFLSLPL
jgi:hypothetical protein